MSSEHIGSVDDVVVGKLLSMEVMALDNLVSITHRWISNDAELLSHGHPKRLQQSLPLVSGSDKLQQFLMMKSRCMEQ